LLKLTLVTSNPGLVDTNKDVLIRWFADGGPGVLPRWYATIAPTFGRTGTATNTMTVSDGTNSASRTFVLTVVPPPAQAAQPPKSPADGNTPFQPFGDSPSSDRARDEIRDRMIRGGGSRY